MPARSGSSNLMRPFVVLALPGMYLLFKYNQYRQQQMETARRRVTERELTHLNTKILFRSKCLWSDIAGHIKTEVVSVRMFAKKPDDGCRRALVDIPPDEDPVCPGPCERQQTKKEGILHKIKLKVIEGGTNFGTSYRRLTCKKEPICKEIKVIEPKALPLPPQKKAVPMPLPRPGVQVSVLGADTAVGQYVALLLKQCPCIKKLRLYEAQEAEGPDCCRKLCKVVRDLQNINTNCLVQAFSCSCCELERCLQSTDIVLMLDGCPNVDLTLEKRFSLQAPLVKHYADCIATECPKAFVIVCASPIDCMVPLVSETLKETGWYDPRKVLGSLAVPEMRASTLAARVLCLEPRYTRVPCVGGTEGGMLVPLFSKAVDCFDFATHNALLMTDAIRAAPAALSKTSMKAADLSEAHALAGLVTKVAHALLCHDIPRVTGYVETDPGQVISPARFIANVVELGGQGITKSLGLPKMSDNEINLMTKAVNELDARLVLALDWYRKYSSSTVRLDACASQNVFFSSSTHNRFDDCAYASV